MGHHDLGFAVLDLERELFMSIKRIEVNDDPARLQYRVVVNDKPLNLMAELVG
jgi:hypothetical protein